MSQQLLSSHKHKRPHHPDSKWSHYTNNDNSGGKADHMQNQLPGQGVHWKMSPLHDQTSSVTLDSRSPITVSQQPPPPLPTTSSSSEISAEAGCSSVASVGLSAAVARPSIFADDSSTPPLTPIISNAVAAAATISDEADSIRPLSNMDNRDGAPAKSVNIAGNSLLGRKNFAHASGFRYPNNTHPLLNPSTTMYRSYPPTANSNNGRYYQQPPVDYRHPYYMSPQHSPQPPYNASNNLMNVMPSTSSIMTGQYSANINGFFPAHGGNNGTRQLTAEEKELKRKISHSAIEKRRRERTNAVLRDLQNIIPGLSKSSKIQKLEILEAAADYIRHLATTTSKVTKTKQRRSSTPRRHHCHGRMCSDKQQSYSSSVSQSEGEDESGKHSTTTVTRAMSLDDEDDQESPKQPNIPMSITPSSSSSNDNDDDEEISSPSRQDPTSMKVNFLLC